MVCAFLGPLNVRLLIGLLFLPYTGMVPSYTIIGAMLAERIHWDRVGRWRQFISWPWYRAHALAAVAKPSLWILLRVISRYSSRSSTPTTRQCGNCSAIANVELPSSLLTFRS